MLMTDLHAQNQIMGGDFHNDSLSPAAILLAFEATEKSHPS